MLKIETGAALALALDSPLPAAVRRLLTLRRDQLGGDIDDAAHFIVAEPGDTLGMLEEAVAFPFTCESQPCFEWSTDHGGLFEIAFITSDDGPAQVILVPLLMGIDPQLIAVCRLHAAAVETP